MKILRQILFLLLLLAQVTPVFAEELDAIEVIPLGKLKVLAMIDARGQMEAALLPDLKNFPAYAPIFEHGPVDSVNRVFYLKDGERQILIDSGWGLEQAKKGHLYELMQVAGILPDKITDILLTHMDFDHFGGLAQAGKAVFPNASLWIAKPEYEAWMAGQVTKRKAEAIKLAQDTAALYKDKIRLFNWGEEILPGITAIDASGHTPGHTAYEIVSEGEKLLIGGDLVHIGQIQLELPQLSTVYDMDMQKAAATREKLLKRASEEREIFAGMHVEPISPVLQRDDGGFMMRRPR